ncbi:transcription factor of the MADS box [Tulasnella sp. 332]|nr:transcription factor of the MADS box [Tulasnella sp. 332]
MQTIRNLFPVGSRYQGRPDSSDNIPRTDTSQTPNEGDQSSTGRSSPTWSLISSDQTIKTSTADDQPSGTAVTGQHQQHPQTAQQSPGLSPSSSTFPVPLSSPSPPTASTAAEGCRQDRSCETHRTEPNFGGRGGGGGYSDPRDEDENDDTPGRNCRDGEGGDSKSRRQKMEIKFIQEKHRRQITFSKRKAEIMKKAYELSTLTGTQVLVLTVSETGLVYTFTTAKLQPLVTQPEGKNLIQACLKAPTEDAVPTTHGLSSPSPTLPTTSAGIQPPQPSKPDPEPTQPPEPDQKQSGRDDGASECGNGGTLDPGAGGTIAPISEGVRSGEELESVGPEMERGREKDGDGNEDHDDSDMSGKGGRDDGPEPPEPETEIAFIEDEHRRNITFSDRKAEMMKKAFELSILAGAQVFLLVVSQTGLVYTFTTAKLQPLVTQPEGRNLIQSLLNAPTPGTQPGPPGPREQPQHA